MWATGASGLGAEGFRNSSSDVIQPVDLRHCKTRLPGQCRLPSSGRPDLVTLHLLVQTTQVWAPGPGDSAPHTSHGANRHLSYQAFSKKGNPDDCRQGSCGYPNLGTLHQQVQTSQQWAPEPGDSAPTETLRASDAENLPRASPASITCRHHPRASTTPPRRDAAMDEPDLRSTYAIRRAAPARRAASIRLTMPAGITLAGMWRTACCQSASERPRPLRTRGNSASPRRTARSVPR